MPRLSDELLQGLKAQQDEINRRIRESMNPMIEELQRQQQEAFKPLIQEQRRQQEEVVKPLIEEQKRRQEEFLKPLIENLQKSAEDMVDNLEVIKDPRELELWKSLNLGARGPFATVFRSLGDLPKESRAAIGQHVNGCQAIVRKAYDTHVESIQSWQFARDLEEGEIDISLPAYPRRGGGLHPSTRTHREFQTIWADMGFQVYQSRDVEEDEFNFTLLNLPPHHPARDMQDTFYTKDPRVLLRTHTSPGQIRAMRELGDGGTKPIRVILPGMCYRQEQVTARSEIQFTQVEGLAIGRNIRMSDLKGTIAEFAKRMYSPKAKVRYRASYFPFTEPSMEVDVECFLCGGEGCRVCKYTGWLEIAGSGMVHPDVLRNGGYDPSVWSGFAFGMGPERITMLKHGIQDIRYFWGNDLRFLQQF